MWVLEPGIFRINLWDLKIYFKFRPNLIYISLSTRTESDYPSFPPHLSSNDLFLIPKSSLSSLDERIGPTEITVCDSGILLRIQAILSSGIFFANISLNIAFSPFYFCFLEHQLDKYWVLWIHPLCFLPVLSYFLPLLSCAAFWDNSLIEPPNSSIWLFSSSIPIFISNTKILMPAVH